MTYYTNSNQIEELMKQITKVDVKPLNTPDPWTDITVYLFNNLFEPSSRLPDVFSWRMNTVMWHRPDWGGMILELMRNDQVYLVFW